jgi:dimethylargininase
MKIALLNKPTLALTNCELTFLDRTPIHLETALQQHADYASALQSFGLHVEVLEINPTAPDAVFVEDTAIILDEVAIMTSMGNSNRRAEVIAMSEILARYRANLRTIAVPASIEGGDVLVVDKTIYVGESSRTNAAGIAALAGITEPFGYQVVAVKVHGCLHLKTGITAIDDGFYIVNSSWVDTRVFAKSRLIEVAEGEPWAANVLKIDDGLIVNSAYPATAYKIESAGYQVHRLNISEFGKAEAGLTCMSLIFKV